MIRSLKKTLHKPICPPQSVDMQALLEEKLVAVTQLI
jgi:hypothetical protein